MTAKVPPPHHSRSSLPQTLEQVHNREQVVQPKRRSLGGDDHPGIGLEKVCPAGGELAERACLIEEGNQVVPPGHSALKEGKLAPAQRMERVRHSKRLHLLAEHRSS